MNTPDVPQPESKTKGETPAPTPAPAPAPTFRFPLSAFGSRPSALPLPPSAFPLLHRFCLLNALALLAVSLWLRLHALENIPGTNGDEAWYGVEAWRMLHGASSGGTPTGNPFNPLFFGPILLLQTWLPPSISLLRSVALASGLAALAINWLLCRWVFDRRTAAISTVILAVLPINIAYSRFAWDASQSLAATLPVVYLALAAVRFPDRAAQWMSASILALAGAVWVHPTNIFAGAAVVAAWGATTGRGFLAERRGATAGLSGSASGMDGQANHGAQAFCAIALVLAALLAVAWIWNARPSSGPLRARLAERMADFSPESQLPPTPVLYPRLFTGGTIYRYIAGSQSWFEWPLPHGHEGGGIGVGVFWACLLVAAWFLGKSRRDSSQRDHRSRLCGRALLIAWALQLAAFWAVAGPRAMMPGQERFAIGLIGAGALVLARGVTIAWHAASLRLRIALAAFALLGWPVLADFHAHYFRFIERTGGEAHLTFRTAAVEPKRAALDTILEEAKIANRDGDIWIVASEWWIRQPIRYFAIDHPNVRVPEPGKVETDAAYHRALDDGRVWFVEFHDTPELRTIETRLAGRKLARRTISDYAGRPLLDVLHPERR